MRAALLSIVLCACASTRATAPVSAEAPAAQVVQPSAAAEAPSLYELELTALDGSPMDASTLKGKAVLFVNVASRCGYTPQYEGLQALYEKRADDGLVIVGVPCNQFMGQEPGEAKEIASFCKMNYGVTFPLLAKQNVNGAERSALYRWLVASDVGGGSKIGWNFEKFVVNRRGEVTARFGSKVTPEAPELMAAVEEAIASR